MSEHPKDYSHPRYDRFRDVPFSRIHDKDGNDVTRERMAPKTLAECEACGIPSRVITEDVENGTADLRCKVCQAV